MVHTAGTLSVEGLFGYADVDDITEEDEFTELVFTLRATGTAHAVKGEDLDDCLEQARLIVKRELTLDDLRKQGLTDADIDRLADTRHQAEIDAEQIDLLQRTVESLADEADEAWFRGFIAGARDIADALVGEGLVNLMTPAESAPAMAAAGEPVVVSGQQTVDDLPEDVRVALSGKEVAITLALVMPARIVID